MRFTHCAAATLATAALLSSPAHAQTADDVASLRRDMDAMRQEYQTKIDALEARLAKAEAEAAAARGAAGPPTADAGPAPIEVAAPEPAPAAAPAGANPNIYNPGIAVALNGFFTAARRDTGADRIAGVATGDAVGRPARGFSLGESEVSFAANVDPALAAFFDFSVGAENDVSLEEAYIRTTGLPGGLTLKAGRFLSGIGYINERHAHDWSFSDAPLPYRAFLNAQFGDDGVQIRWIAPTDQYLEFGAEAFRGQNYPAAGAQNNGVGAYSAFARTGADINASSSWLAGLSYLHAEAHDRLGNGDSFSGKTDLGIATLVYKWAPGGNPLVRNLTVAGEYFYGQDDGAFNLIPVSQTRTGWYAQGVYQFKPQWSAGLRVAGLRSDSPGNLLAGSQLDDFGHSPMDYTALLEYDTSEFGRLRLQYTYDDAGLVPNDILTLQYTVIYGPHGAHRY